MDKVISSKEYTVYIPESGDPLSGLSALECGDIDSVDDNTSGVIQSNVAQSYNKNRPVELLRFREYSPSAFDITMPEDVSREFHEMMKNDCMFGVQRRFFCEGELRHALHYGYVSFNNISVRNAVNKGLYSSPSIPTSVLPAIYNFEQYYDGEGPAVHIEVGWNPIQVTYCDSVSCSPCVYTPGCDIAYALYSDENGDTKITRLLVDGSGVVSQGFFALNNEDKTAIFCHEGRLFVGMNGSGYNVGVMTNQADITDDIFTPKSDTVYSQAGPDGAVIKKFAASGGVVYVLWSSGTEIGVSRNLGGYSWDTIDTVTADSVYDISAIGSSIAFSSSSGVRINYENGFGGFETINPGFEAYAIKLFLPDFSLPNCPAMFLLSQSNSLYGWAIGSDPELFLDNAEYCSEETTPILDSSDDGYGLWISRAMNRRGQSVTMKSIGKGLDCNWFVFREEEVFTFDCDSEVTIDTCTDFFIGPLAGNRVLVTLLEPLDPGVVTICFQDATTLLGYLYPANDLGQYVLAIQTDELIGCSMRSGLRSLNCSYTSSYPCMSWHEQAFAMCPSDPNRGLLVLGASCPTDDAGGLVIVKDFDNDGEVTELISCSDEGCQDIC